MILWVWVCVCVCVCVCVMAGLSSLTWLSLIGLSQVRRLRSAIIHTHSYRYTHTRPPESHTSELEVSSVSDGIHP